MPLKLGAFWATWKLRLIAGAAVLLALAIAIYASHTVGYNKGKNLSRVEIQRYEKELAQAQAKIVTRIVRGDTKVVTQYRDRVQYEDRIVYVNRDIIRTQVVDRPLNMTVSNGWIHAHNKSALAEPIDPSTAADSTASGIPDTQVLLGVTDNYAIANQCITRLQSLQALIKEREKALAKN